MICKREYWLGLFFHRCAGLSVTRVSGYRAIGLLGYIYERRNCLLPASKDFPTSFS